MVWLLALLSDRALSVHEFWLLIMPHDVIFVTYQVDKLIQFDQCIQVAAYLTCLKPRGILDNC